MDLSDNLDDDNLDKVYQISGTLKGTPLVLALLDAQKAYQADPDNLKYCFAYAYLMNESGQENEAVELFKIIIKAEPNWADPYFRIARIIFDSSYFNEALPYFIKHQTLKPNDREANLSLASCYYSARDFKQAEYYYQKALILDPGHSYSHEVLGYLYLLLGEYEKGWQELEWRQDSKKIPSFLEGKSLWRGVNHDISSLTLLVYVIHGVGDNLQFARFLPLLKKRAKKVILVVRKGYKRLFQEMEGIDLLIEEGQSIVTPPHFDVYCSLEGLAYRLGITLDNLPNQPYLEVSPNLQARWQTRLGQLIPIKSLKVGLVWAGEAGFAYNYRRSMPLKKIAEIGQIPGITFISLQKDGSGLIEAKQGLPGFPMVVSLMDEVTDLADSAAIIKNLDLVISVDTAMAHLAGGLGVPVWILNRFDACWRWLDGRDDSPWYPSARLYRQTESGNWSEVLARVRRDLTALQNNNITT